MTEKTVSAMRSSNRWDSIRRGEDSSLAIRLKHLGALNNKHIPTSYLQAAPWQRLALLQGLMDTDGSVSSSGRCEITLKDDRLGRDLGDLLSGLGTKWGRKKTYINRDGRVFGPYLRYSFSDFREFPVFRLRRKLDKLKPRPQKGSRAGYRQIVAIEPVDSVPVRCIQVDSPSQLYLAGRKMVPTHNSSLAETACIRAVLHGHCDFICLIGSDGGRGTDMLESIKTELDGNDLLLEDFPEVV